MLSTFCEERMSTKTIRDKCKCGYDKSHYMIEPHCKYDFWGWVALLTGITAMPLEVSFRCEVCHQVLEITTDREVMKKYS